MDYRIQEIIKVMRQLDESAKRMPMAKLNQKAVSEGLRLSANVCKQPEFVFATPWMKNLLVACGDVKQTYDEKTGEWHTEKLPCGKDSKAVALVNQWVKAALLKFNGAPRDHYNEDLPVDSIDHLDTDCWLGWKEKVWDIQPGQAEQRAKVFKEYTNPTTNCSVQDLINLLQKDATFQKAVLITLETLPEVRATREVTAISDPFMAKGSGVSYPDYKNDRTPYDKDITYGKYEIMLTQKAADAGLDSLVKFAYDNNVYTGYPRNQRGKGRALEAESRRTNLVVNCINAPEMEEWKRSPILGTAFQNEEGILKALVSKAEFIEAHPNYVGRNEDTSSWDKSVGAGWITLSGAVRYLRANGAYSKKLVEVRHNCARKAYFVDGPNNKVSIMYGRTPSGYDDTTLLNSTVHRILANYALLKIDPHYTENVVYPTHYQYMDIVGDDICTVFPKGDVPVKSFREIYKQLGYTIHEDEKSIFGVMFIQYRVVRDPETGKWILSYNWPRVYRSMLSKETAKQLGEAGWVLSAYQQLGKLIQYPKYCQIPLNLICACDQFKLHLDTPISKLKEMAKEEDQARVKEGVSNKKDKLYRKLTLAERLSNNPTLPGTREDENGNVELDWDYFEMIQSKLRPLYDPEFLTKLGFTNPNLSIVH